MDTEKAYVSLEEVDEFNNNENSLLFYQCKKCDMMAISKTLIKLHMVLAHYNEDTPFPCSKCKYRATTRANLKRHDAVVHSTGNRNTIKVCSYCEYCTHKANALRIHIREVHLKEKPHQCGECPFRCSRASDLKRHLYACHEKQGPFKCPLCKYSTSTPCSLSKHIKNYHKDY